MNIQSLRAPKPLFFLALPCIGLSFPFFSFLFFSFLFLMPEHFYYPYFFLKCSMNICMVIGTVLPTWIYSCYQCGIVGDMDIKLTITKISVSWSGLVAQLVGASCHSLKGCRFYPHSGRILRLQFPSLVGAYTGGKKSMFLSHINVSLCLFPFPSL